LNVLIRKANYQDTSSVIDLMFQLLPSNTSLDDAKKYNIIFNELLESKNHDVILAEFENRTIGLLVMSYRLALHHRGLLAVIEEFVVDENYRGESIGTRLIEFCTKLAKERNAVDIEVVTAIHRERTHKFYQDKNFIRKSYVFTYHMG
jgi:GNAT superfamily N-acetyltransferase